MAISFIAAGAGTGGSASTFTSSAPSGAAVDDIMVIGLYRETTGTITPPSGWTEIGTRIDSTSNDHHENAYWKRHDGATASFTFAWPTAAWRVGGVLAYRGCDTASQPDGSTASNGPNSSVVSFNAITLHDAGNWGVCVGTNFTGGSWTTTSAVPNKRVNPADDIGIGDYTVTSSGVTSTKNFTFPSFNSWTARNIGLSISAGGGGAPAVVPRRGLLGIGL